ARGDARGWRRIKRKRGKWVAEAAYTLPAPEPTAEQGSTGSTGIMGIDLGVKVPAVVPVIGKGTCFFGNGRQQRATRRRFYARRKALQRAKKVCAVRTRQGKEARWMRDTNHKLSRQIITHAQQQGVGRIRLERSPAFGNELSSTRHAQAVGPLAVRRPRPAQTTA